MNWQVPANKEYTRTESNAIFSSGDVYKAAVEFRTWAHISLASSHIGGGISIICKCPNTRRLTGPVESVTVDEFFENTHHLLNLKDASQDGRLHTANHTELEEWLKQDCGCGGGLGSANV